MHADPRSTRPREPRRWLLALALGLVLATPSLAAPAGTVKVLAPPQSLLAVPGASLLADYGSFQLYRLPEASWQALSAAQSAQLTRLDERILYDALSFDPTAEPMAVPEELSAGAVSGPAIQLIQFVGPVKDSWLEAVRATGAQPIHYVANQGYLVLADDASRRGLAALVAAGDMVRFSAPLPPYFKLGSTLRERYSGKGRRLDPAEEIPVTLQMVRHSGKGATEAMVARLARRILSPWTPILGYQNLVAEMRVGDVLELVRQGDVSWVGERLPRELHDELQDQVIAGHISGTGATGPGYLAFLTGLGFPSAQSQYPVVDITDDGIGNGTVNSGDPVMHEGGSTGNPTRLAYVANCTAAANGGGPDGHGHLNTSIVGGYDTRSGFPFRDPDGYQRGMGVNPFGRLAGTRIFGPNFDQSACAGTDTGVILSVWQHGARINTNSWGCSGCAGSYDDSSQAYDVGVRDADLATAGNQQLIEIFSAGNSGPSAGTVGTPGNGKNMITVGASENHRPSDEGGSWTDGCNIGPTGADNVMDVISFSSRGPAPGSRKKPEVIAPGTHIHGTASTNAAYNGSSVCDQFRPPGQTTFAASSGTSHSTPAVAGVASLVYWWLENNQANGLGAAPSPAMMKAYLMAHPTYLTGVGANDTLPSNSQGYGMPNLELLFDDVPKFLLDQTQIFNNTGETWTWSGAVADPSKPVRIALAYVDQAGAIGTSPQVNNLNLDATVAGTAYHGNVFSGQWSTPGGSADSANNYEAVFVQAGASGAIEITVSAANIAGDGVPNSGDTTDQDFAIVCYNCVQEPTFTLQATPASRSICAPATASYDLAVGSVLGFSDPVTLSVTGHPAGTTTGFTTNPVTPPGSSTLTLGNTSSGTPGSYTLQIQGVSGAMTQTRNVALDLFTAVPGQPSLLTPANGATNVAVTPTFTWAAVAQAASYAIEIATDAGFTNIVASGSGLTGTSFTPPALITNTQYFWRVRSTNACGTGSDSTVFHFVTLPAPGDCALGVTPTTIYGIDFESGSTGWTTGGTGSTWALATDRAHSATHAMKGLDLASVTDQYLISPSITLPAAAAGNNFTLQFWNNQEIEDNPPGCFDGAVAEISTNGGTSWTRLEAELLTDPYNGVVSSSFSSPIAGQNAWCGDPQDWLNSIVDIDAFAGQTVKFRFRLATDSSVSHPGWWIDDVTVRYCSSAIFLDGFETGNTSAWAQTVP